MKELEKKLAEALSELAKTQDETRKQVLEEQVRDLKQKLSVLKEAEDDEDDDGDDDTKDDKEDDDDKDGDDDDKKDEEESEDEDDEDEDEDEDDEDDESEMYEEMKKLMPQAEGEADEKYQARMAKVVKMARTKMAKAPWPPSKSSEESVKELKKKNPKLYDSMMESIRESEKIKRQDVKSLKEEVRELKAKAHRKEKIEMAKTLLESAKIPKNIMTPEDLTEYENESAMKREVRRVQLAMSQASGRRFVLGREAQGLGGGSIVGKDELAKYGLKTKN